jgi:hypothetical protein
MYCLVNIWHEENAYFISHFEFEHLSYSLESLSHKVFVLRDPYDFMNRGLGSLPM